MPSDSVSPTPTRATCHGHIPKKLPANQSARTLKRLSVAIMICVACVPFIYLWFSRFELGRQAERALMATAANESVVQEASLPTVSRVELGEEGQRLTQYPSMASAGYLPSFWGHLASTADVTPLNQVQRFSDQGHEFYYLVAGPDEAARQQGYHPWLVLCVDEGPYLALIDQATSLLLVMALGVCLLVRRGSGWLLRLIEEDRRRAKTFCANASHELKTPLMAIAGYVEALESGLLPAERARPIIHRNVGTMSRLVDQIILLSQLDELSYEAHIEEADLREIAFEALEDVAPLADARHVILQADLPCQLPLRTDGRLAASALTSLLSVVVRQAQGAVEVSSHACADWVEIVVSYDAVPGDATAVDSADSSPMPASFDLSLAQECATQLGGELHWDAAAEKTTFHLRLPRK